MLVPVRTPQRPGTDGPVTDGVDDPDTLEFMDDMNRGGLWIRQPITRGGIRRVPTDTVR